MRIHRKSERRAFFQHPPGRRQEYRTREQGGGTCGPGGAKGYFLGRREAGE
jgi:hypothetical protein